MHMYYLSVHTCIHTGRSVSLLRMRCLQIRRQQAPLLPLSALPLCQGAAEDSFDLGYFVCLFVLWS